MAVKSYNPTTASRRNMTVSDFSEITATSPLKSLTKGKNSTGGRNSYGRVTTRFRGAGNKRRYRMIDFLRAKDGVPAKVVSIEYDPNRTARIALLAYADGEKAYIPVAEAVDYLVRHFGFPEYELDEKGSYDNSPDTRGI